MITEKNINEGHRKRLRQRFAKAGFENFSEHEIIELLLTLSITRKDVKKLAKTLLKEFGSLKNVFDATPRDLRKISGIGEGTSLLFKLIIAANDIYLCSKLEKLPSISSSAEATNFWKNRLSNLNFEVLEVAYLDSSLCLLRNGIERVETGVLTATTISIRKIAESAMHRNASGVILAHNHPCGSAKPSDSDERNTKKIKFVLQELNVVLVDHVIVSKNDVFSFKENGLL